MGKSRGPRNPARKSNFQKATTLPAAKARTFWTRTKAAYTVVIALVGAVTTLTQIYRGTIPDARILGSDPTPFLLPFTVTNDSSFFDMKDVVFFCGPRAGQTIQVGNIVVSGVRFQDGVGKATIKPGATSLFRCPVTNARAEMVKGTIHPIMEYRTLWFSRTFEGKDLTWFANANPPRWVEGDMVK